MKMLVNVADVYVSLWYYDDIVRRKMCDISHLRVARGLGEWNESAQVRERKQTIQCR